MTAATETIPCVYAIDSHFLFLLNSWAAAFPRGHLGTSLLVNGWDQWPLLTSNGDSDQCWTIRL